MKMSTIGFTYIKIFQLFCIILVVYMIYQQILEYQKNEDSTSVSYRSFNQDERDLYPSYSICIHSTKGAILKGKFSHLGESMRVDELHKMLIGRKKLSDKFKEFNLENNAVDIVPEFVDMFVSYTKQGREVDSWNRHMKNNAKAPFYSSYQDPYFRCVTKSVEFVKNQILHYDYLVLDALKVHDYMKNVSSFDDTINLFLYVHHPGQLVREFGKQTFQLNIMDFENAINGTNNHQEIHVSHVEVIRKRPDGVVQCNDSLANEDYFWVQKVVESLECVPKYWEEIYRSAALNPSRLSPCNSSDQYAKLHKRYLPPNNFETVTKLYKEPCNQMKITTNLIQKDLSNPDNAIVLAFNYNSEEYRESRNHCAFGLKSLWSQIGGFIGIFLGYGLMQVPALLKDFFCWLGNKCQKYKTEGNPSRKEGQVYSLKKIVDELNEDNRNCLNSMITSIVPTSRNGNLRKSFEREHNDMKIALEEKGSDLNEILNTVRIELHDIITKQTIENQIEREKMKLQIQKLEKRMIPARRCGLIEGNLHNDGNYCPTCGIKNVLLPGGSRRIFEVIPVKENQYFSIENEKSSSNEWL